MEPIKQANITGGVAIVTMLLALIFSSVVFGFITAGLCAYTLYLNLISDNQINREFRLIAWTFNTIIWVLLSLNYMA